MFGIKDVTVFESFEQAELEHPTSHKAIDDRIIYVSSTYPFSVTLARPHGPRKGMKRTCSQTSTRSPLEPRNRCMEHELHGKLSKSAAGLK